MATRKVPCEKCAREIEKIEIDGAFKATGCEPIAGEPGWCLITFGPVAAVAAAKKTLASKTATGKKGKKKGSG